MAVPIPRRRIESNTAIILALQERGTPTSTTPPDDAGWQYLAGTVAIIAIVAAVHLDPHYLTNETVYLVRPRQLHDPSFLDNDWTFSGATGQGDLAIAFAWLMALLFRLFDDGVLVALVGRLIGWIAVVGSIARLCHTLKITPVAYVVGVSLWFLSGQSAAAGEWILGGVEQKVPAYACLLLSLAYVVKQRYLAAGIFCGVAVAFHILVGGWGSVALAAAAAFGSPRARIRDMLPLVGAATLVGGPFLLIALNETLGSPTGGAGGAAYLTDLVLFRNPHHLDPAHFLSATKVLSLTFMTAGVWISLSDTAMAGGRRSLVSFLGTLLAFFLLGLIARLFGWMHVLYLYPFRVGDALIPLFFWLTAIQFLEGRLRNHRSTTHVFRFTWGYSTVPVLVVLITVLSLAPPPRTVAWEVLSSAYGWKELIDGERSDFDLMADWIATRTARTSVFAVSPCRSDFWMKAERAMVVNFKYAPASVRYSEWRARLEALGGSQPISARGFQGCGEVESRFAMLEADDLAALRQSYGADYYLSAAPRPELGLPLVHAAGDYHLYYIGR